VHVFWDRIECLGPELSVNPTDVVICLLTELFYSEAAVDSNHETVLM